MTVLKRSHAVLGTDLLHFNGADDEVILEALAGIRGEGLGTGNRDRKSTRLNSSHSRASRMPSSA